jgi:hypothetical protein
MIALWNGKRYRSAVFCIEKSNKGLVEVWCKKLFFGSWGDLQRFSKKPLRFKTVLISIMRSHCLSVIEQTFIYNPTQPAPFYDLTLKNASLPPESSKNRIFSGFQWFSRFLASLSTFNHLTECIFGISVQNCIEWHVFQPHLMTVAFSPYTCHD